MMIGGLGRGVDTQLMVFQSNNDTTIKKMWSTVLVVVVAVLYFRRENLPSKLQEHPDMLKNTRNVAVHLEFT